MKIIITTILLLLLNACSNGGDFNITVYRYKLDSLQKSNYFFVNIPENHINNIDYYHYKDLISTYLKTNGLKETKDIQKATYIINFDYQLENSNTLITPEISAKTVVNSNNNTTKTIYYNSSNAPVHYLTIDIFFKGKLIIQTQAFNTTSNVEAHQIIPFLICASFDDKSNLNKYTINYDSLVNFKRCGLKV